MAYCTISDVKTYLSIEESTHDTLLADLISRAEGLIESYTHRNFEVTGDTTRLINLEESQWGDTIYLPEDLCAITTLTNNADGGASAEVLTKDTHFITEPRYNTPWTALKMLASSDKAWEFTDDPEEAVSILGRWGFSTTPPDDIVHACIRLTAWLYRKKDAPVADISGQTGSGGVSVAMAIPNDVEAILRPYQKRV